MKTLRSTILEMCENAEDRAVKKLNKKGYLTYEEFDRCLQVDFNRFLRYYLKKGGVGDPFSEEFTQDVFDEYEKRLTSKLGLKTLIPKPEIAEEMEGGLIGFDEKTLKKVYVRLKKRIS